MKKLIYLIAIAVIALSCKDKNEVKVFKSNPDDKISLHGIGLPKKVIGGKITIHYTDLEIVKKTTGIQFIWNGTKWTRGFESNQRDTISSTPSLLMYATDIITTDGEYKDEFIGSKDCILVEYNLSVTNAPRDTIGYISNASLKLAKDSILEAYKNKDYNACQRVFKNAFIFKPITGAEYIILKQKGDN